MLAAPSLLAGAAVVNITPVESVFLFGYPHVPRMSTGVHDPLTCTALYLRSGADAALFLAHDLIFFPRAFVVDVRRRIHAACGVPEHAILVSATHTHSGPVVADQVSNAADSVVPRADRRYLQWLADRIVEAASQAVQNAEPAEIGVTIAHATGVGSNRHDPAGPADPDVPILLVRSLRSQQPLACLLVHAMHPTIMHEDSTLISGDLPHFTRAWLLAHALPASCAVLYLQGASGNQSPRHTARENTFAEAQRLGELLGRAIAAALPALTFRSGAAIHVAQRMLELEPRQFPSIAAADGAVEVARARFAQLKKDGASRQALRTAECDMFGAEETAELARVAANGALRAALAACLPAEIQLIEIGPWRFVAWPGEFFVEYGLEVKAGAADTFLVTLANGELQGYIATEDADRRGYYEARNAVFAAANGRRFVEATLALLAVKKGRAA
jgi:neutral ceramidase